MAYNPPRQLKPQPSSDPLEVSLVFNVRPCGTCSFFWPDDPTQQPYGPYTAYDFVSNTPATAPAPAGASSFPWLTGVTRPPVFPNAEVMGGCRKAPIMTLGINPNLTAFLPGQTGASWCYPDFSNAGGTDPWTKFAYYYRYRSTCQEHFALEQINQWLAAAGRIVAEAAGVVVGAERTSEAPSYNIKIKYDTESASRTIPLTSTVGEPPYVLLFNPEPPANRFQKGDILAARVNAPVGQSATVYAQQIGYYEQFVPTLSQFEGFLQANGHASITLAMGEDVGQLDMVACASPHWGPQWLGKATAAENAVIQNCVSTNAWALKQLVQTRPAVLFLVGEASYSMFQNAFGKLITADPPLPATPEDGAFTLLRATTDASHPCRFEFSTTIGGTAYALSTRLVVSPHFSYNSNFVPQFRIRPADWQSFEQQYPQAASYLQHNAQFQYSPPNQTSPLVVITIPRSSAAALAAFQQQFTAAAAQLMPAYYDAHAMMESVLENLYQAGQLSVVANPQGGTYLARTAGPCVFCVNAHWSFPLGCPYGKPDETALPVGFLEQVAQEMVQQGKVEAAARHIMPSLRATA